MKNLTLDKHELGSVDTLIAEMNGSNTQPEGGALDSITKAVDSASSAVEAGSAAVVAKAATDATAATDVVAAATDSGVATDVLMAAATTAATAGAIMSKTQNIAHLVEKLNLNGIKDHLNLKDLINLHNSIVKN
ncbi:MAG: hypothetical protein AAF600_19145 [Bacteroidota bacterium]